ncbi:Lrp/AsnC ligand binding domain-containing protein [Streptomyces sp. NBC_01615]|uniref:Lrp/AsnC ligand binding domain-containing protein n=1 Tax=Streptomyces sp. NBC_01615 TaxID=2975898 RepID=UPI003864D750
MGRNTGWGGQIPPDWIELSIRMGAVIELRRLFGSPDYFVRVAVADLPAYETFLSRHVMTIPRIKNVTSHFTMKVVKTA